MVVFKKLVNQGAWMLVLVLFRMDYTDIDSVLVFLLFSLYFFQKGIVLRQSILRQSILRRCDIRLLRREGDEEWVLKSVEVPSVRVLCIWILLLWGIV